MQKGLTSAPLSTIAVGHENNLALIRLICAFGVIVSHSYALIGGINHSEKDLLSTITSDNLGYGAFAVGVFFLFGGYLIAGSAERSKTFTSFIKKRILRIIPELAFLVLMLAFVIGPLASSLPPAQYFTNPSLPVFLLNIALIPVHSLPGLFNSNPYPNVVDGSLWTLPVEFSCYLLVFLSFKLTHFDRNKYLKLSAPIALLVLIYFIILYPYQISVVRPVLLYWIGTTAYVFKDSIHIPKPLALGSFFVFCISLPLGWSDATMLACFPIFMAWLAFSVKASKASLLLNKLELSYGVYLWGWPAGQLVVLLHPNISVEVLALTTIIFSLIMGFMGQILASRLVNTIQRKQAN